MSDFDDVNPAGVSGAQRIGNHEREAAVAALQTHHAEGRIDSQEYEERSVQVQNARTWEQLHHLFVDLPAPRPESDGTISAAPVNAPAAAPAAPVGGEVTAGTEGPAGGIAPDERRGGLVPEPWAWMLVALTPIVALVLFFISQDWEWFLAIPIVGILVYGPEGGHRRNPDRHRDQRRDRRRGRR